MESYYTILDVPESADLQKIKKAYKKLAVKFHPDKNPNNRLAEERFKQINEAYQTLSNTELRQTYDYLLLNLRYQTLYTQSQKSQSSQSNSQSATYEQTERENHSEVYSDRNKDQVRGITWAIGILGMIAILVIAVLSVLSFLNYLEEQKLAERRAQFREKLQGNLSAESYKKLMLDVIYEIDHTGFNSELSRFKSEIFSGIREKANSNFGAKSYETALSFYEVWKQFKIHESDLDLLNTRISLCHKYLGNNRLARSMFEEMVANNSNLIFAHYELAKLEESKFGNLEKALFHYEQASEQIVESYIRQYGGISYGFQLDPKKQPEIQFDIYLGKGVLYNKIGKHKECIIACNWASVLRAERSVPYFVKAQSELALNHKTDACAEAKKAYDLGLPNAEGWLREVGCGN